MATDKFEYYILYPNSIFFGVPIFSENGKTLIRLPFGSSPKSEAHVISIFRVAKRWMQKSVLLVL